MSTQHIATLLGATCWVVWLPCCDLLWRAGCCWIKFDHLQTRLHNSRFFFPIRKARSAISNTSQHGGQTHAQATCCAQQFCDMLRSFGRTLIHLIFESNSSKSQILRALSNWMRPFDTLSSQHPSLESFSVIVTTEMIQVNSWALFIRAHNTKTAAFWFGHVL